MKTHITRTVAQAMLFSLVVATAGGALYYRIQTRRLKEELALVRDIQQTAPMPSIQDRSPETGPPVRPPPRPVSNTATAVVPQTAMTGREDTSDLLEEIASLRADVVRRDRLIQSLQAERTNAPAQPRRRGRSEWMAELKKKDSKRYEELIKRREQAREQSRRALAEMSAYYLNRDTARMDKDEKEGHAHMLDLLEQTWQLTEQLQAGPPREERRQIFRSLIVNVHELAPMLQNERDEHFKELGQELGYSEEGAADFANYLNEVIDLTTISGIFHGLRRGPPGTSTNSAQQTRPQQ